MYMPDIKVYIRKENIDKWNNIHNKSEWINTLLKNSDDTSNYGKTVDTPVGPAVTVLSETLPPMARACCLNKTKPCKHWNWTGENYTNILTGEIREVDV